jgi:hypothetical protein
MNIHTWRLMVQTCPLMTWLKSVLMRVGKGLVEMLLNKKVDPAAYLFNDLQHFFSQKLIFYPYESCSCK